MRQGCSWSGVFLAVGVIFFGYALHSGFRSILTISGIFLLMHSLFCERCFWDRRERSSRTKRPR
jgi:hypothetical protein